MSIPRRSFLKAAAAALSFGFAGVTMPALASSTTLHQVTPSSGEPPLTEGEIALACDQACPGEREFKARMVSFHRQFCAEHGRSPEVEEFWRYCGAMEMSEDQLSERCDSLIRREIVPHDPAWKDNLLRGHRQLSEKLGRLPTPDEVAEMAKQFD
jgi:hypothetical protein